MLKKITPIMLAAPLILGGCASNISSSHYESGQVGEATRTYQGVIVNKRVVKVEGNSTTQAVSAIAGAVGGGVLGNQVGGGSGKTAATVAGAALGGVIGNEAGKKLSAQEAYEYTVKLNNGEMRTVVQGADVDFAVGTHVLLQISSQGRSRIVPNTGAY